MKRGERTLINRGSNDRDKAACLEEKVTASNSGIGRTEELSKRTARLIARVGRIEIGSWGNNWITRCRAGNKSIRRIKWTSCYTSLCSKLCESSLSLSVSANGNHSCIARVSDISSRSGRHAAIFLHFASRFVPKSAIFESTATVELEMLLEEGKPWCTDIVFLGRDETGKCTVYSVRVFFKSNGI